LSPSESEESSSDPSDLLGLYEIQLSLSECPLNCLELNVAPYPLSLIFFVTLVLH